MSREDVLILGIESSCDETAASVVKNGRIILSNCVASQADFHEQFGGVVPELASRMHIDAVYPTVEKALSDAGVTLNDIDAVAVTYGPGLVGALLVGLSLCADIESLLATHVQRSRYKRTTAQSSRLCGSGENGNLKVMLNADANTLHLLLYQ
jgi:tRNA A37 threonylcarbamoyltransferase TsaD